MSSHLLSLVSNFRNENPYLGEWLAHHVAVGVDHVYLYDQDGSKEAAEILQPYLDSGFVTLHDWTKIRPDAEGHTFFFQANRNHLAYKHAASTYRDRTRWLLKIDIDEFLVVAPGGRPLGGAGNGMNSESDARMQARRALAQAIQLSATRHRKAIRVPRFDFGSNGHESKPPGGVRENFLRREASPSNYKDMADTIFLNDNRRMNSSHRWSYVWRHRLSGPHRWHRPEADLPLRIHHYYTKSREEFFRRQNIDRGRRRTEERFARIEERCAAILDDSILRWV